MFAVCSYFKNNCMGFIRCFKDREKAEKYIEILKEENQKFVDDYMETRLNELMDCLFDFSTEAKLLNRPITEIIKPPKYEYKIKKCGGQCDICTLYLNSEVDGPI